MARKLLALLFAFALLATVFTTQATTASASIGTYVYGNSSCHTTTQGITYPCMRVGVWDSYGHWWQGYTTTSYLGGGHFDTSWTGQTGPVGFPIGTRIGVRGQDIYGNWCSTVYVTDYTAYLGNLTFTCPG